MKTADTLFINGQILTQDENRSKASQLALSAGRILAVGDDLSTFQGQTTEIIDLQGSVITPGFIDAHLHFLWGGSSRLAVPIHEARSKQDFIRIVSEYAKTTKAGSWITGAGWNEHKYSDASYPQKEWLDEAAPGHPSILIRHDGHSAIASSKALALAGINHDTPDPIGGIVDKDEQGQPTGILREAAIGLVDSLVPEESDNDLEKNFEAAQEYLLDHGVTAIGDMIFDLKHFHFLQKMALQKKLKIRVTVYLPILKWTEIKSIIAEGIYEDEWFQFKGLKGFCDGSLGSHTALMLEPYDDTPEQSGIYEKDWEKVERIREILIEADQTGLQAVVHAIGDRANREVLDIFEAVARVNGPRDRRFRIEHAQHIHPEDQKRFSALGVIASVQPAHCVDDARYVDGLLGDRSQYAYPFRSLLKLGAKLAFGSDWPVSPPDPVATIHAAIHRAGWRKEESIDLRKALYSHTAEAAYSEFRENDLGRIETGYLADFVILSSEFLNLEAQENLSDSLVESVYVNGKKVR